MAGKSAARLRSMRWLLLALAGVGLVWATPSAASPLSASNSGQRGDVLHSVVVGGLDSASLAPPSTHRAVQHLRSTDLLPGESPAPWRDGAAVTSRPELSLHAPVMRVHALGQRAPPVEGLR